jgi:predicted small lipoprotein YifL
MSLSFDPTPFNLVFGIAQWLLVIAIVIFASGVSLTLMSLAASGVTGPLQVLGHVKEGFADLLGTSPRRVIALSMLTFREAFRRKTLWVFAVFGVLFLFAGWFMSDVTADPSLQVKAYVSFVLRTISWLILPVVMLLACWGLPEDIRLRSLHTVVTKPVRRHEVVLGRIIGFVLIGAFVLVVMGTVGYVWVVRQLPPSMQSQLTARVPIYGNISFLTREGRDATAGINVGDESMFRSFVEGNSKARAIWDFTGIYPERLAKPGNLVLESSFQAFRTHKGNMQDGLLCQLTLVNDEKNVRVPLKTFNVKEFHRNVYDVAEKNPTLTDVDGKQVNLEKDLLNNGKLRVEAACLSGGQLLGMARPDLFVRLPDRSFAASYFKSIFSIGLMMVTVIVLGVVAGCFVKGPVATLLTTFVVVVGRLSHGFMEELTSGYYQGSNFQMHGRGILDSLIRIPTHKTPGVEMGEGFIYRAIQAIDNVELMGLWAVQHLFPDLRTFDTTEYVANAFDVPWAASLLPSLAVTVGYCIPWIVVGYYSLKVRELEAK